MGELVGVWICLGVSLAVSLMLGVALLVSVEQHSTLERQRAELEERNAQLCGVQYDQGQEINQLRSALRAEMAHVAQLLRKVELIKLLRDDFNSQDKAVDRLIDAPKLKGDGHNTTSSHEPNND